MHQQGVTVHTNIPNFLNSLYDIWNIINPSPPCSEFKGGNTEREGRVEFVHTRKNQNSLQMPDLVEKSGHKAKDQAISGDISIFPHRRQKEPSRVHIIMSRRPAVAHTTRRTAAAMRSAWRVELHHTATADKLQQQTRRRTAASCRRSEPPRMVSKTKERRDTLPPQIIKPYTSPPV